jgi:hypothetical protein
MATQDEVGCFLKPPAGKRKGNGWAPREDGTFEWRGITQAYKPEQLEQFRERLETHLFDSGWRLVTFPWLEKGDSLFELETKRILTDRVGVFIYRRQERGWKLIAGYAGYEKEIALGVFS